MYADLSKGQCPSDNVEPRSATTVGSFNLLTNVTSSGKIFACPSDGRRTAKASFQPGDALTGSNLSYSYGGAGLKWQENPDTIIACDNDSNHRDGGNVLYADGRVEFLSSEKIRQLRWKQKPYPENQAQPTDLPPATTSMEGRSPVQELTALDVKGGFREYRLGMKKDEVRGDLTKQDSFTEDTEEYAVKGFDHALGAFQIDKIELEFDRRLAILKEVSVWVKGKQNVEGVLEAFKVAYGEPEKGGLGSDVYSWRGIDLELRYSVDVMFDKTATATWTSKKVDKLITDDRTRRAREGASDAAKGL